MPIGKASDEEAINVETTKARLDIGDEPGLVLPSAGRRPLDGDTNTCNQTATTLDIAQCLNGRTKVWDARLNQVWKALNAMLNDP